VLQLGAFKYQGKKNLDLEMLLKKGHHFDIIFFKVQDGH
jgi:hypothetical protein